MVLIKSRVGAMPMSDDAITTTIDVEWRLFLIYFALATATLLGCALFLTLILVLRRFEILHANFCVIFTHTIACLLVNNILQALRPFAAFSLSNLLGFYDTTLRGDGSHPLCAAKLSALSTGVCIFLSIALMLLATERLYATLNYAKYEYEDISSALNRFFIVLVSLNIDK